MSHLNTKEAFDLAGKIAKEISAHEAWATEIKYYKGSIQIVSELRPLKLAKAIFSLGLTSDQLEYTLVEYNKEGHPTDRLVLTIKYRHWEK